MREVAVAGAAADFRHRGGRVLIGHHHRGLEARFAPHPVRDLPFIEGGGGRRSHLRILVALAARLQRIEDAGFDSVEVKVLLAGEVEVTRRRAARRRARVAGGGGGGGRRGGV